MADPTYVILAFPARPPLPHNSFTAIIPSMPVYRRNYEGEIFFFTIVTCNRMRIFDNAKYRSMLSDAIKKTRKDYPWEMAGIVLLPNHLHMIWELPQNDTNYSRRISLIKRHFTESYLASGGREAIVSASKKIQRYRGVWQRKFWEHTIRNAKDFRMHLDYIHGNPVKHDLSETPADWPWSSFRRYVDMGWYESNWQGRTDLPDNVEYVWNK